MSAFDRLPARTRRVPLPLLARSAGAALAGAAASAQASGLTAAFPAYLTFTLQALHCDPYTSLSACTGYDALSGTLTVIGTGGTAGPLASLSLGVDGESTDDKHKGEIALQSLNPGTALSFTFGGTYQSMGSPLPAAHPAFALAPAAVVGPSQGVPASAPSIALGTLASPAFSPIDLTGPIYAFGTTQVVGSWEVSVSSVPEPSPLALGAAGLAVVAVLRCHQRRGG